ncbi:uncharacterized protein LOC114950440 isoform X3 [Acropora millepora]|uniref:uncharacterized protein LOC114950440 isoform X3 n=1 Tax=Acropora millepora TaxID=45264 RepID=UPI001CF32266|nr:uncharacterized protein LOC114950440 isoform X3 [Acropora millepora]
MQLFGGDAKKKVFLYWSPGPSSSSVPAVSSPCTSTVTSTTNAVTSSSSSTIGSFHMSTPAPNHATSSTSTISSTNSSSTTTTSTLAAPVSSGSPTLASIASPMSRPTNSRETRRYLEHLATVSSLRHSTSDTDDNNDEAELLQSPFSHDVIEIDDPSPQSVSTQVSRWSRFQSNTGFMVKPFHGNGLKAGTVEEDLSPNGLGGSSLLTTSRSDEVVGCQRLLQTGSDQTAMLPFLIHSFDELCFQAGENNRGIIVVLLNTKITNEANRGAILRVLHKLETAEGKNWLFWVSSTWSSDGTKVIDLYGGDQKQDRLLFLAPSTGRNATLLGEISDTDTESNQIDSMLKKIIERAELRIMGQRQQREQYAKWRRERKEQEEEFARVQTQEYGKGNQEEQEQETNKDTEVSRIKGNQEEQEQETNKDTEIRKARRLMTSEEPLSGTTIVIRCNDGERVHRKFQENACFQEVYDWLGSLEDIPLYFTLQRGKRVVEHTDIIQGSEVLDLLPYERIREVRRKRVSVAPLKDGMKVILHLPGNKFIARRFCRGACFQEVYDWAGSMEDVPLHFTIHRGGKLVTHESPIDDHCAATLVKRAAEEAAQMLSSQVSFYGSYTFLGPQELSNTLPDDSQATQEQLPEDGDIIKEKKRRKDKRTTSERKRAKKEKSATASTETD